MGERICKEFPENLFFLFVNGYNSLTRYKTGEGGALIA